MAINSQQAHLNVARPKKRRPQALIAPSPATLILAATESDDAKGQKPDPHAIAGNGQKKGSSKDGEESKS